MLGEGASILGLWYLLACQAPAALGTLQPVFAYSGWILLRHGDGWVEFLPQAKLKRPSRSYTRIMVRIKLRAS